MTAKKRVLVVDDEPDFVAVVKRNLEQEGFEVEEAYDGDEGLCKAREENPDLILMDVIMPVKDGFTAADQLKKDPHLSQIPTLMLTGFAAKRGETAIPVGRGLTLETEDYIDKPVSPQELLARVEKYIKKLGF